MDKRTFAVERLGVGDWPRTDGVGQVVIGLDQWNALIDIHSRVQHPAHFAFDVAPDRSSAAIAVVGRRADGLLHAEIVDRQQGTGWLTQRIVDLVARHSPTSVVCDAIGPAASLIEELERAFVRVTPLQTQEVVQACGLFFDAVEQQTLRHLGTSELTAAIKGAARRPLGDAWAWSRRSSAVDIAPLVAVTLALSASIRNERSVYEARGMLTV